MSWSPDLFIGEMRPWPDSVHVVRGKTDEVRRYMPERKDGQEALERRIDELCAEVERHKAEYARLCDGYGSMSREHTQTIVELSDAYDKIDQLKTENAKLREAVATAIKVQAVLCGDADSLYCRKKCPLHRQESDDCLACDVIGVAQELGIEAISE